MKVIIFNDLFNGAFQVSYRRLKKLLIFYNKVKLQIFINNLRKKHNGNIDIQLIDYRDFNYKISGVTKTKKFSDLRHNLSLEEYSGIVEFVKENTKEINVSFQENLKKLKHFNMQGIPFADLLEIHMIRFFNPYTGEIELAKQIIKKEKSDKIILFNCNPLFVSFFKDLNKDIEVTTSKISSKAEKLFNRLTYLRFILLRILIPLFRSRRKTPDMKKKKNIILVANSRNQYNSIKPIYKQLKKNDSVNPLIYVQRSYLPLSNCTDYVRFMRQKIKLWKNNIENICVDMGPYINLMKYFFDREILILFSMIYNEYYSIADLFKYREPSFVTISNELRLESKLITKYCKKENIPTLFIPHAGVPMENEVICKKDFKFLALWGSNDINYYLDLGMLKDKLVITGSPKFENFYKEEIMGLSEVKDMFSNRIFKFTPGKKSIMLATTRFDDASIEKLIQTVVLSLKELNLIDNLIIKIHPADSGNLHKRIINKLDVKPFIIRDDSLLDLMKSCSLLITCYSSIALEAMMIGTPVIEVKFVNLAFTFIDPYIFTQKDFIKNAENLDSLTLIIKDLFKNEESLKNYSKQMRENSKLFSFYDEKEPPTERIIKLILKEING